MIDKHQPRPLRRQRPARRSHRQHTSARWGWPSRLALGIFLAALALLGSAMVARRVAPASNTSLTRFDAIIVLGNPADKDGNPRPEQLARVTEAVHEYERGVAPRLILSGGAAANRFVEAEVMARSAKAQGLPDSAIWIEPEARDTIENACYSVRIMKNHGWHSAEVISSAYHLPRAGWIFNRLPIEWRMHAAPPLAPESAAHLRASSTVETLKTMRYLIWARWTERCEP